jgi:hypothetical protein
MPYYRAIFRLPGGKELKAHKGYVPDAFFEATQKVTVNDIVDVYEGGFVLSNEMHEKLNIPHSYTSYAITGKEVSHEAYKTPDFNAEMLQKLKQSNHARPLEEHHNYQVFYMEHIEEVPDDD